MKTDAWSLHDDRFFGPHETQKEIARTLFAAVRSLPLVCPHTHVDPKLFADPQASFGSPAHLLLIPDHYIFRMLHSQGISLASLGIAPAGTTLHPVDPRSAWQIFADNIHLFRATPVMAWLQHTLCEVFGIQQRLTAGNAQEIYDQIDAALHQPHFSPRSLYERFNIEVLCTTDHATDTLEHHHTIARGSWAKRILPTFRPDALFNLDQSGWINEIRKLSLVSAIDVHDYDTLIRAIEQRRDFFRQHGCRAADHGTFCAATASLSPLEADAILQRAFAGTATVEDTRCFTAHMLMESARMSCDDGLVMQLHVGVHRNHNLSLHEHFGPDKGGDIPVAVEWVESLKPLLNRYGNHANLTLIVFCMDESTYSRELAPLAGHYPAVRVGPPWWFLDSINGMNRYFDMVIDSAGLYNTAGFNDDTRALPSIPARHDVWRRCSCNWLAGLVCRQVISLQEAEEMARELTTDLARRSYRL